MKFATWLQDSQERAGVVAGERAYPFPIGTTVVELANAGLSEALDRGARLQRDGEHVALSSVQLKAPLHPPSIRDFVAFEYMSKA